MLRNKIIALSAALVLLGTSVTQYLFYHYTADQVAQTNYENSSATAEQASDYLEARIKSIIKNVHSLANGDILSFENYNSVFAQYLLTGDPTLYPVAASDVSRLLTSLRVGDDYIRSVYIHTERGEFVDNTIMRSADYRFETSALKEELGEGEFRQGIYWGAPRADEMYRHARTVIPMVFRFQSIRSMASYYIVVNLDQEALHKSIAGQDAVSGGNTFLYSWATGDVLLSHNQLFVETYLHDLADAVPAVDSTYEEFSDGADSYYVFCEPMEISPWVLVVVKSQRDLFSSLNATMRMAVLFTCGSVLFCVVASVVLSHSITQPLRTLEQNMRHASEHRDFDVRVKETPKGEVGSLIRSFNSFVKEIRDLIARLEATIEELRLEREKVKVEQDQKRAAELRALQAQINPHFLYNTLNSIAWMAQDAGVPAIGQMTKSLGTFFEMSLSRGREFILVREEKEQIEAYLSIQKIRYEEMLSYSIEIPEELGEIRVLKLILQPLVENAIYHGIKESDQAGCIVIRAESRGDCLVFTVSDNGVGMPEGMMDMVNRRLEERYSSGDSGYGIYNVNERIKMAYGDRYGLRYRKRESGGVVAEIVLPLTADEVEWNV